jgi:hypothetical protein
MLPHSQMVLAGRGTLVPSGDGVNRRTRDVGRAAGRLADGTGYRDGI